MCRDMRLFWLFSMMALFMRSNFVCCTACSAVRWRGPAEFHPENPTTRQYFCAHLIQHHCPTL